MIRVAWLLWLLASSPASAQDRWSWPHAGVAVLERRAPGPLAIRAAMVDLCTPGIRVRATRPSERGLTTGAFAERTGALVAINGDFFERGFVPVGLAIGGGEPWPDARRREGWSAFAAGAGRAEVVSGSRAPWMREAVGGVPQLVVDGVAAPPASRFCMREHPRSALGIDREGRTLIVATIDGRSPESAGASCARLAAVMAELGAWQAINLDGGGSSALYVAGRGVINAPSDGGERAVANHLAILGGEAGGVDACPGGAFASIAIRRGAGPPSVATHRARNDGSFPWPALAAVAALALGAAAWRGR